MKENSNHNGLKYKNYIDINNKNTSHYKIYNLTNKNDIVLDVGCACGDLGYILYTYKQCTLYGLEYNQKSIEIAQNLNIYKKIWQCDLNNLQTEKFTNIYNFFDCIICGDILEHLYNPSETLSKLTNFLKPNGYIIISIPNIGHFSIKSQLLDDNFIYTEKGLLDNTHIRFFTKNSISTFLTNLNLQIDECEFTISQWNGTYPIEIFKKINTLFLFFIHRNKFSHIFQFVLKCTKSEYSYNDLITINKNKINNIFFENNITSFKTFLKNIFKVKLLH